MPVHESAHEDCDIQYDLEQPFLWEGDTVVFRAWCASEDADVVLSVSGAPDAVFTPEGTFSWFTTGRDGCPRRHAARAGHLHRGMGPAGHSHRARLPLDTVDVPATFTVRGDEITGEVKIRGATSVAYPKNSFTLDFDSDELSVEEWGSDSRGHMVLTSTFDDNSYMRQKLTFDV